jgi:hypothetical protein
MGEIGWGIPMELRPEAGSGGERRAQIAKKAAPKKLKMAKRKVARRRNESVPLMRMAAPSSVQACRAAKTVCHDEHPGMCAIRILSIPVVAAHSTPPSDSAPPVALYRWLRRHSDGSGKIVRPGLMGQGDRSNSGEGGEYKAQPVYCSMRRPGFVIPSSRTALGCPHTSEQLLARCR